MAIRKKVTKKTGARSARSAAKKSAAKKPAARKTIASKKPQPLRIGDRCSKQGGVFIGIAKGENGQPDCYVYRGRYAEKRMTHADAQKFAAACTDGKHKDWQLPTRTTGALVYANGRADMRNGWHWLQESYAGNDAYAWCQNFSYGTQPSTHKSNEFEVVLVRRVPIQ